MWDALGRFLAGLATALGAWLDGVAKGRSDANIERLESNAAERKAGDAKMDEIRRLDLNKRADRLRDL